MTPQEFKKIWTHSDSVLLPTAINDLQGFDLKPWTTAFLMEAGLPDSAAPFLSFMRGDEICRLTDYYNLQEEGFENWIVIGDCDGDPIAINTAANDRIELLDHENNFAPAFFNSSIATLAECLVAYTDFGVNVREVNGEDAFSDGNFTDAQMETLRNRISTADSKALEADGFWCRQLEMDLSLREWSKNNP